MRARAEPGESSAELDEVGGRDLSLRGGEGLRHSRRVTPGQERGRRPVARAKCSRRANSIAGRAAAGAPATTRGVRTRPALLGRSSPGRERRGSRNGGTRRELANHRWRAVRRCGASVHTTAHQSRVSKGSGEAQRRQCDRLRFIRDDRPRRASSAEKPSPTSRTGTGASPRTPHPERRVEKRHLEIRVPFIHTRAFPRDGQEREYSFRALLPDPSARARTRHSPGLTSTGRTTGAATACRRRVGDTRALAFSQGDTTMGPVCVRLAGHGLPGQTGAPGCGTSAPSRRS